MGEMGYYQVKPNQTLAEVRLDAAPHLSVFEVKEHERNKALFALRNEFQLRTGDSIWIPDEKPQPRWFSVTAGQSVKFVTTQPKRPFKLVVRWTASLGPKPAQRWKPGLGFRAPVKA